MNPVVENESQLQKPEVVPEVIMAPSLQLDVIKPRPIGTGPCQGVESDCGCEHCAAHETLLGQAACVMMGASAHENEKHAKRRLGAQSLHWGILLVGMLLSIPILLPTLSPTTQDWIMTHLLNSPGNWKLVGLSLFASCLFALGFVNRLGRERVLGGCAMIKRLGPAAILGVAWSTLPSFAGVMMILNMEPLRQALVGDASNTTHLVVGACIYLVGFVLLAGIGFLPTISQAILAGYAFGAPLGFGLALGGFGGASLVGYELVRRIARSRVEAELTMKPKAMMLRDALIHAHRGRALLIVTLLRASPSSPFALTNLLLGSLGVSRKVFFFGTIMGMIPRTLAAVLIGQQFSSMNNNIDKPRWMFIAGIVALVLLLITISKIAAGALGRMSQQSNNPVATA